MKKSIILILFLFILGCGTLREQLSRSFTAEGQSRNESAALCYYYFKGLHERAYREPLGFSYPAWRSIYVNGKYQGEIYGPGNGFPDMHLYGPSSE